MPDAAGAKTDVFSKKGDRFGRKILNQSKNMAELWQQPCNACIPALREPRIALRMQHIYLAAYRGECPRNEQFMKRKPAMAATQMTRPAPFGAITTYRFVQLVDVAFNALATWNDARLTRKALGKLSDHELDDIGLCRADIDSIGTHDRA